MSKITLVENGKRIEVKGINFIDLHMKLIKAGKCVSVDWPNQIIYIREYM